MVVDRSRRRCLFCDSTFTGRAFICRPCADRFRDRPIPESVLRAFYAQVDLEYPEWANTYGNYNPPRALISEIERFDRDASVLEIGAGGGFLLEELWNRGFRDLTGSDITTTTLTEMTNREARISVVGADATSLPFRDATFDVVVSSDVIEHLPVVTSHLIEVHRVLRPCGSYLLKTPNRKLAELYYRLRGLYDHHIWHPSMFSPAELTQALELSGFQASFLPVAELTAAQLRKIPSTPVRTLARQLPIRSLPAVLHPHLEVVARRVG